MAGIRKVDSQQVRRAEGTPPAATPEALSPSALSQILAKAFGDLTLHGNELPALDKALKQAGPHAAEFKQNIERRLQDPNLKVTGQSLDQLAALGVDVTKARANLAARTDLKTTQTLSAFDGIVRRRKCICGHQFVTHESVCDNDLYNEAQQLNRAAKKNASSQRTQDPAAEPAPA